MTGVQPAVGLSGPTSTPLSHDRRGASPLVPGIVAIAIFAWWAVSEGGVAPGAWYPGALLFLAALAGFARRRELRALPAPARWAAGLLAAFTLWSFLSLLWADARGDAWDGANRTLLYLTVFGLFAVLPWTTAEAAIFLAGFALAIAGIGAWELIGAIAGSDPEAFAGGRLAGPIGYENASAALFLAAFWPAVLLATRRAAPGPVRGILLAAASVLLDLGVLAQSRGSLIAGPVALVLALALTPERGRLLLALTAISLTALAALPALLAVFEATPAQAEAALGRAGVVIAVAAAVLLAAGWASAHLERRRVARSRPSRRWIAAAAVGTLALGAVTFALARPDAVPGAAGGNGFGSRFTAGVESGRYDFWRVAARQVARHPLQGAGADNFAEDYVRERRRGEEPLYPHSIVWRTFGQTGIVGGVLLIGFFAAASLPVLRRRHDRTRDAVAVAALICAAAWLTHASIDWLWELPALAAPAMACLGLVAALSVRGRAAAAAARPPALRRARLARALAVAVAVVAAVSYALPALAAREIERAVRRWEAEPAAALRGLDRARRLNPLTDRADVVGGALTLAAGDRGRARRWFERALARDPRNWYPEAELGLLDLREGRRAGALARLRRAGALNPREPAIATALSASRRGVQAPPEVEQRLSLMALPGPLGRRPVSCRPVLGLAAACVRRVGA